MAQILPYIQIILAVLLISGILLQQSEAGLGAAFGGGDGSANHTRRGAEKFLFQATIIIAILFFVSTVIALVL